MKQLHFVCDHYDMYVERKNKEEVKITIDYKEMILDRNLAHLLKLWLEEHLK